MIDITRASSLDAEVVSSIDRACFREPTVNVETELKHPWSYLFLAWPEGESTARAFLLAWLVSDELHVLSVATWPQFQRRGLGRALLAYAIEFARSRGGRTVLLEVRRSNQPALDLYRAFGFVTTRVRPRYYADNMEDAIEMTLAISPPREGS
ncbi:MAG TPA: ribosomal protein S18-alanine N-acetyltransferase [Polyangiaceae bacterium]|nr:ribosomal protein S18-alanine N-acetyltransferase [Polyangiaceae bacterium]